MGVNILLKQIKETPKSHCIRSQCTNIQTKTLQLYTFHIFVRIK